MMTSLFPCHKVIYNIQIFSVIVFRTVILQAESESDRDEVKYSYPFSLTVEYDSSSNVISSCCLLCSN